MAVNDPDNLLLKVPQSVEDNWPELAREANGKLMVKELVEVLMLKTLPAVPVATEAITPEPKLMEVDVPINTF